MPEYVRVRGLRETARALQRAGAAGTDMRDAMRRLGGMVARAAAPRAPRVSGRLAGSVRGGGGKTKAVVRAGGARVPYAGVRHYGWPARNIEPAPFLLDALQRERPRLYVELDRELDGILRRSNLR